MNSGKSAFLFSYVDVAAACILVLLLALCYSNTFNASWHLDDIQNIVQNRNVHLKSLTIESLAGSVRSLQDRRSIYRPVAMISFGLNWYFGGPNVAGFHMVNIAIHCLTSILLYCTILGFLRTPKLGGKYAGSERFIAFFAAAFWALHPIQIQAVTYIVQRMACLSALFYLGGIFCYVRGRAATSKSLKYTLFAGCGISYLLAMGSKENAVTLPAALLMTEILFFRLAEKPVQGRSGLKVAALGVGASCGLALLLYLWGGERIIEVIVHGYRSRPFTLSERVLTESRIVVFYLSQLVFPDPRRFSIMRQFSLSKSFADPPTTAMAVVFIALLVGFAVMMRKKRPLFTFAILFFFLGHIVESSVIPLELYFEHRNYLPSFFLFVPLVAELRRWIDSVGYKKMTYSKAGFILACLMVIALGRATYVRNQVWANEETLWMDAMKKAPSYARPVQNVAMQLQRQGRLDEALGLYRKALALWDPRPALSRFISLSNMGNLYKKKGQYAQAIDCLSEALSFQGDVYALRVRYNLVLCLLNERRFVDALGHLDRLIRRRSSSSRYLAARGFVYFKKGDLAAATVDLIRALRMKPGNMNALLTMAMVNSAKGSFDQAERYLQTAARLHPDDMRVRLGLLENAARAGWRQDVKRYMKQIEGLSNRKDIDSLAQELMQGRYSIGERLIPLDASRLRDVMAKEKAVALF